MRKIAYGIMLVIWGWSILYCINKLGQGFMAFLFFLFGVVAILTIADMEDKNGKSKR